MSRSIAALAEATRQRQEAAEKAVQAALRQARKGQTPVTVAGIAAAAGVSTDFIYRHQELRPQVEALRRAHSPRGSTETGDPPDTEAATSTLVRRFSY
jgi:hypothetical protein